MSEDHPSGKFVQDSLIGRSINVCNRKIEGAETSPATVGHRGHSAAKTRAQTLPAEDSSGSLYVLFGELAFSSLTRTAKP